MAKPTCPELADSLARIHTLALALTRGWGHLESDHRGEVIQTLHDRVGKVMLATEGEGHEKGTHAAFVAVEELRNLEGLNKPQYYEDLPDKDKTKLLTRINELTVAVILDCGCKAREG